MDSERIVFGKEGKKYLLKDYKKGFHSKYGAIEGADLKTSGIKKTKKGDVFAVTKPVFIDIYDFFKRGAQIMSKKDIGAIISETGVGKDSFVVDAGTGSGFFSVFLANIAKKVVSYDINESHLAISQKNVERTGFKNIKIKKGNICNPSEIIEKNADLINLDIPEPDNALETAYKVLKKGGFLTAYNPSVMQSKKLVDGLIRDERFIYLKTIEVINRSWVLDGQRSRPSFEGLGHTGFIVFARKI